MAWHYVIETGELYNDETGLIAKGYSGFSDGKNNPRMCAVHDVGPLPCGAWEIVGPPIDTPTHGPYVLRLEPRKGTLTHGRSGFLIHGDSIMHPGTASHGCLIFDRHTREMIWESMDHVLYCFGSKVRDLVA